MSPEDFPIKAIRAASMFSSERRRHPLNGCTHIADRRRVAILPFACQTIVNTECRITVCGEIWSHILKKFAATELPSPAMHGDNSGAVLRQLLVDSTLSHLLDTTQGFMAWAGAAIGTPSRRQLQLLGHLPRHPLHRAASDADQRRHLQYALAGVRCVLMAFSTLGDTFRRPSLPPCAGPALGRRALCF